MINVEDVGFVDAPGGHSTLPGLRHDIVHTKALRRQARVIHPVFTANLAYGRQKNGVGTGRWLPWFCVTGPGRVVT